MGAPRLLYCSKAELNIISIANKSCFIKFERVYLESIHRSIDMSYQEFLLF